MLNPSIIVTEAHNLIQSVTKCLTCQIGADADSGGSCASYASSSGTQQSRSAVRTQDMGIADSSYNTRPSYNSYNSQVVVRKDSQGGTSSSSSSSSFSSSKSSSTATGASSTASGVSFVISSNYREPQLTSELRMIEETRNFGVSPSHVQEAVEGVDVLPSSEESPRKLAGSNYGFVNEYSLYDFGDGSWFSSDQTGTAFYVADVLGSTWYYTGTLCSGSSQTGGCELINLPPGCYVWRTTGHGDPHRSDVSFSFCGIKASAMTEIAFEVETGGWCVPKAAREASALCAIISDPAVFNSPTVFTVHGAMHLGGSFSSDLSVNDTSVIEATLAQEVSEASKRDQDLSVDAVAVDAWEVLSTAFETTDGSRRLSEGHNIVEIRFRIRVSGELLGISAAPDAEELAVAEAGLSSYLHMSMRSGAFRARLLSRAREQGASALLAVAYTHLKDLRLAERTSESEWVAWSSSLGAVCTGGVLAGVLLAALVVALKYRRSTSATSLSVFHVMSSSSSRSNILVDSSSHRNDSTIPTSLSRRQGSDGTLHESMPDRKYYDSQQQQQLDTLS